MGQYLPSTAQQRAEMLQALGLTTIEDLYENLPSTLSILQPLDIPAGKSEVETLRVMSGLANKNYVFPMVFRGAGAYRHYIPAIVPEIVGKEAFLTAYTPYQAEISQGVLQSIFEYQTMICELTGMDVSNASVYDGANAAAEAVAMCRERKKTKAVISGTANPQVIETMKTYCWASGHEVVVVPGKDGASDTDALLKELTPDTACLYIQNPNYFGVLEDVGSISGFVHQAGAKLIVGVNPISAAILKTPAESGADIVVGEGQPLGMPLSFGGPYLGFMASTEALTRKLPGRIVGETTDASGARSFVLTLQAREQHIRREKASSNICSNQALCAMTASVYMAAMGPSGLCDVAEQCYDKAHYLSEQLSKLPGFKLRYNKGFFHELVTECPIAVTDVLNKLKENGILGGMPVESNGILWCVTEMNTKEEIDGLISLLKEVG